MIRVVPFTAGHLTERYVSWLNDPTVTRYSEQRHRTHTLETCRAYYESFGGTPNRFWAIELDIAGAPVHIGNMSATVDARNMTADLAIMIGDRQYQRRGYGLEAWRIGLDLAADICGARRVTAGTMAVNAPMLKVFERSCMVEVGRRRGYFLWEGQPVDMVMAETP